MMKITFRNGTSVEMGNVEVHQAVGLLKALGELTDADSLFPPYALVEDGEEMEADPEPEDESQDEPEPEVPAIVRLPNEHPNHVYITRIEKTALKTLRAFPDGLTAGEVGELTGMDPSMAYNALYRLYALRPTRKTFIVERLPGHRFRANDLGMTISIRIATRTNWINIRLGW